MQAGGNGRRPKPKVPELLLALGPEVFKHLRDLQLFILIVRAYLDGVWSLRQAHRHIVKHGWRKNLKLQWEQVRHAAFVAEGLFGEYFQAANVSLFERLPEGLPWIGVSKQGMKAYQLALEFNAWCQKSRNRRDSA